MYMIRCCTVLSLTSLFQWFSLLHAEKQWVFQPSLCFLTKTTLTTLKNKQTTPTTITITTTPSTSKPSRRTDTSLTTPHRGKANGHIMLNGKCHQIKYQIVNNYYVSFLSIPFGNLTLKYYTLM